MIWKTPSKSFAPLSFSLSRMPKLIEVIERRFTFYIVERIHSGGNRHSTIHDNTRQNNFAYPMKAMTIKPGFERNLRIMFPFPYLCLAYCVVVAVAVLYRVNTVLMNVFDEFEQHMKMQKANFRTVLCSCFRFHVLFKFVKYIH